VSAGHSARSVGANQLPLLSCGNAADAAPELLARGEQCWSALEQEPPRVGQVTLVRRAVEQRHSKLLLEQPHLAAHRRLGDVEPFGGAREVALASHRQELLKPPEVGHRLFQQYDRARGALNLFRRAQQRLEVGDWPKVRQLVGVDDPADARDLAARDTERAHADQPLL
jgi:hypothetical protein